MSKSHGERIEGSVFVTGADSGMGEITTEHLAGLGFHVFAGHYLPESGAKLGGVKGVTPIRLDVTKLESIAAAKRTVEQELERRGGVGLVALVNCAGVGFSGPCEYFPIELYREQLEVNLLGYIAMTQAFMPLLRQATEGKPEVRRGRVVFIGTGGGVPSPAPALLSAYMASKWGVEAFCQSLRLELKLTEQRIDACMINPGFVKPTGLEEGGRKLLERTWSLMPARARDEYGPIMERFLKFSDAQKGTHPRFVALAIEEALAARRPRLRYLVGFDSKVSPIVGLLPAQWREWLLERSMYAPSES